MSNSLLIKKVLMLADFSESESALIIGKFKEKHYSKNEFILQAGHVCRSICFIETGLVQMFHLLEGKEITTYLGCDDCFAVSPKSFLKQEPSQDFIMCLESTNVLAISFEDMEELYQTIPNWNIVGRKLMEETVLCLSDRLTNQHHIKAKDRYLNFKDNMPAKIVRNAPIQHIATFLGIAPESLSRIRKEIVSTTIS